MLSPLLIIKNNYYYNIFVEKSSYELPKKKFCVKYRCYFMTELTFLKELVLIRQAKAECNICHYWNFLNNVLMPSMNLSDIAILNIKGADYCCIISGIRKSEAMNLMQNID